jgi:hypothetical protein
MSNCARGNRDLCVNTGYLSLRPAVSANQTTTPRLTAFELQDTSGKWTALPPTAINVSSNPALGVTLTPTSAAAGVMAVRYAWSSIPSGLLIYGGVGPNPTPAANFYAKLEQPGKYALAPPALRTPAGPN